MAIVSPVRAALYALLASSAHGAYTLKQTYDASNLFSSFNFKTASDFPGGDPTDGFVNYLSQSQAQSQGLAKIVNNQVFLGVDNKTKISDTAQGRNSVRLESKKTFDKGLLIADISHMPGGACGVWPAFWTYNNEEDPMTAEIDIIEGTNFQTNNIISLHTCGPCNFTTAAGSQTGNNIRTNCDLAGDCLREDEHPANPDGCGATATTKSTYGDSFNSAQGGVYVTQLETNFLKIWHFPRSSIPADITAGKPDPNGWGKPMADFEKANGGCDVGATFQSQTIIINIDFCGTNIEQDAWNAESRCRNLAPTCPNYVANHPEAFSESYWLFNTIKVYQQ